MGWSLVPWPGMEPRTPALGAQSLSHWATWEVPVNIYFYFSQLSRATYGIMMVARYKGGESARSLQLGLRSISLLGLS